MQKKQKLLGAFLLSLAASIWGGMFVVVKVVVTTLPPVQLVWCRYLVAVIVLFGYTRIHPITWHWDRRNLGLIVLIGLIGDTLSIVTQETGTWLASAQLGSVITTATPAFMVLFSWPLLHERPQGGDLISLLLATGGVVLIVGTQFSGRHVLLGALLLFVAGLTWALMSVLVRLVAPQYDVIQVTWLAAVVAVVALTPIVIGQGRLLTAIHWTTPSLGLGIFYLGAISTALAFVLWNQGLRLLNSSLAGLFFLCQPVVGTLLGWLFLGEPISWAFGGGTLLIFLGMGAAIRWHHD
ncbi:DMT family transporter [Levilactobacillus spicheri]|uniref:Membrane protein n=1 Tax=Levilactobacillus spicheri TaxID=216463 RepID=A0A0F3RQ26_9LACO|nr:DMT family transporter [Levilactobacillus spicheri]KJW11699.1 membrane protein [Levilactobacillus spicheri]